jgi:predicted GIY-YIG superfamily endonuclease
MTEYVVYALYDPREPDHIRYIGFTADPDRRLIQHLKENSASYKSRWVQKLLRNGHQPHLVILGEAKTREEILELEINYIAKYRQEGNRLTNGTEGGTGGRISQEATERMKATLRTPAARARRRRIAREVGRRPEIRQARSENARRQHAEPDALINSAETRRKFREARNRNWADPAYREKCSQATTRRWQNPDFREKMLVVLERARRKRWASKVNEA